MSKKLPGSIAPFHILASCAALALLAGCGGSSPLSPGVTAAAPGGKQGAPPPAHHPITHVLYTFQGGADGIDPWSGLIFENGQLYGTTHIGGSGPSGGWGTVFRMSTSGTKTTLYNFQGGTDAGGSEAGVTAGPGGVLFGNSVYGGGGALCSNGCGAVYELVPSGSGYTEKVIYALQGGSDGAGPVGSLLVDQSDALYGTTVEGGGSAACTSPSGVSGCGAVFKVTPSGSGFSESVLYGFQGGSDGIGPRGALIEDGSGALYGTTYYGGGASACTSPSGLPGCGAIFRLTPSGSGYRESILYSFQGGTDGAYPRAGLLAGSGGTFFGATTHGGPHNFGTVYELMPSGSGYSERILYSFTGQADGRAPSDENGLYADASGNMYGTSTFGGRVGHGNACYCGTVFKLAPSGSGYTLTTLYRFKGSRAHDGSQPRGSVTADSSGVLYGTTTAGGLVKGYGTIFKISP